MEWSARISLDIRSTPLPTCVPLPLAEVPIIDGSALGWATEVQRAGLRPAPGAAGAEVAAPLSAVALQEVCALMSGGVRDGGGGAQDALVVVVEVQA